MAGADLLLHPVRLRIVQTLLGGRTRTTTELRDDLPDTPPATLYRHVAALLDGGVLEVADERRVRGVTERTYRLREEAASVSAEEASVLTADEHRQAFLAFVGGLLHDFDRYLARGDVDLGRDQVGYRQVAFHLTDDETTALLGELAEVMARYVALPSVPGRTRRIVSRVVMPAE